MVLIAGPDDRLLNFEVYIYIYLLMVLIAGLDGRLLTQFSL